MKTLKCFLQKVWRTREVRSGVKNFIAIITISASMAAWLFVDAWIVQKYIREVIDQAFVFVALIFLPFILFAVMAWFVSKAIWLKKIWDSCGR